MATSEQASGNAAEAPQGPEVQPDRPERVEVRPGIPGPVFGPDFYVTVLPDRVMSQCQGDPNSVPVVNLNLANGRTLDLCHITHLTDRWMAVQYFRDSENCDDMDVAFLPYDLVMMVTVSVHHSGERPIGFNVEGGTPALSGQPVEPHPA